ncbi:hypothetical protein SLE2022_147810 [Rubroshorea leprosula]
MSIALERIDAGTGFRRVMTRDSVFESPLVATEGKVEEEDCRSLSGTTSSSSIGRNSDEDDDGHVSGRSSDGGDGEENEVQSSYKNPLDMMDSLEEVLPIRRGISSFYNGKSKSFAILADAVGSPSIKDIAKPENAYTRRRRNLLAINHVWDKNRNKKPITSSRSTLALAVAMSSSESLSSTSEESSSTLSPRLPPLHPQSSRVSYNNMSFSPPTKQFSSNWRSFSVADIQQCTNTATTNSH